MSHNTSRRPEQRTRSRETHFFT